MRDEKLIRALGGTIRRWELNLSYLENRRLGYYSCGFCDEYRRDKITPATIKNCGKCPLRRYGKKYKNNYNFAPCMNIPKMTRPYTVWDETASEKEKEKFKLAAIKGVRNFLKFLNDWLKKEEAK